MPNYPPYSPEKDRFLVKEISDWSLANGLVMLTAQDPELLTGQHAPVTTYPSSYPKAAFEEALKVQTLYNKLYVDVCQNKNWLEAQIQTLSVLDPDFTGRLVDIYHRLKADPNGFPQKFTAGLFRSDYLLDGMEDQIKQVEFNTVSVSFGGLSSKVGALHKYLFQSGAYGFDDDAIGKVDDIQVSKSVELLASGLFEMVQTYNTNTLSKHSKPQKESLLLFVVQPNERNALDQRLIEYELTKKGVKCARLTLSEVEAALNKDDNATLIHPAYNLPVSVVYYRSAYAPTDYPTELEWSGRYFLEQSDAIKCPSVLTQLSGAKKIQQLLTNKEIIKQVSKSLTENEVEMLTKTFVGIYSLDEQSSNARRWALTNPTKYVLKPQREGGGNNVYKDDIPAFLQAIPDTKWGAYILMELINPKEASNKIVRAGKIHEGPIISELGVFGTVIFEEAGDKVLMNNESGHLLRTKFQNSNEGGVAAGFGCVDSIILV